MKRNINDRQRKMQLKQKKSENARKKSLESLKIRTVERLKEEIEEVSKFEKDIQNNYRFENSCIDKLYIVNVLGEDDYDEDSEELIINDEEESGWNEMVNDKRLRKLSSNDILNFLKSLARVFKIIKKKLIILDKCGQGYPLCQYQEEASLEFTIDRKNKILVMGKIPNNIFSVEEIYQSLKDNFIEVTREYLPEVAVHFQSLEDALDGIEAYKLTTKRRGIVRSIRGIIGKCFFGGDASPSMKTSQFL